MTKRKTSKTRSAEPSLLERVANEWMRQSVGCDLPRGVVDCDSHIYDAMKYASHFDSEYDKNENNLRAERLKHLRDTNPYATLENMDNIGYNKSSTATADGTKTTHREWIDAIIALAESKGALEKEMSRLRKVVEDFQEWKREANENAERLRGSVEYHKNQLLKEQELSSTLHKKIHHIKAKVEKKAMFKQPHLRRVDARNILALINTKK